MKNSPEILNELRAISPLLAGMEKTNVFTVPEGYFNDLEFRITNYAILNNTSPAENINKRNLQEVPSEYFDTLSDSILAKVKAIYSENAVEELRNLSPMLFGLKGENVFTVPAGYFDKFSDSVLSNMKSVYTESAEEELRNLSPILYSLKGETVFTVPENYFDNLCDSILVKAKAIYPESAEEELRDLSPMLYSLKRENVFTVPAGYFESLAENVTQKLKPVPAKVVTMKRRTSWLKYAAAAVVTGIITITSLQLFKGSSHNISSSLPAYFQDAFKYKTEADVNAGIAKLDDADIAKYLEKNGNVLDNELLINNTDESGLPSSTDYLNDENTLNEYLDKIDAENISKAN